MRSLEMGNHTLLNFNPRRTNMVIRMGGIGDLVILSASLRALKEKEPWRPLVLATLHQNLEVLAGADYLDAIIPITNWNGASFHRLYDLRWKVEPPGIGEGKLPWLDYCTRDRSDVFDDLMEIKRDSKAKTFGLSVNHESLQAAYKLMKEFKHPWIALAPTCKSAARSLPLKYIRPLMAGLKKKYEGTLIVLGKAEVLFGPLKNLGGRNVVNLLDQLTIPEMMALISIMDAVISVDSAPVHIAGALGVKCLALFGNIDPKTRVSYYPTVKPLWFQNLPCIPCWDKTDKCERKIEEVGAPCMKQFTPQRIIEAFECA